MAYEALARKYRPRTFEEVVGQGPIIRTLTNALREGRIHHAYVFSGVRGVGKTTVARIFAKALNCENGPTPTPCLKCDACVEIAAGRDLDVIEMDAASRTGVDDVRDLIDTTRYAPARDRYKVFIIDEFHMLSKPAFNALLKTLEEPPPRVVFLMATTELHKVLPTVLSRTQQFDFRKVRMDEIVDQLAMIAKKEQVKAPRVCLEMLSRAADGSVRDAESLLDQAIAYGGAELREPEVRTLLGLVPEETVEAFLASCADRDAGALLRILAGVLAEGLDLRIFHAGLIEGLRRLLVLSAVERPSDILGLAEEDEKRLSALAARFSTESLLRVFSVLAGLEAPLKYSDQPRYLFEAAVIRLAAIAELSPIEDLIARLEAGEPGRGPGSSGSGPVSRAGRGKVAPSTAADPARPMPPKRTRDASGPEPAFAGGAGERDDDRSTGAGIPPGTGARETAETRASSSQDEAHEEEAQEEADTPPGDDTIMDRRMPSSDPEESSRPSGQASPPSGQASPPSEQATYASSESDEDRVGRFLAMLQGRNERLSILIARTARVFIEEDRITLVFEDSQAFARKSIEQPQNLAILHEAVREAEGRELVVEVRRATAADAAPPTRETASASPAAAITGRTLPAAPSTAAADTATAAAAPSTSAADSSPAAAPRSTADAAPPDAAADASTAAGDTSTAAAGPSTADSSPSAAKSSPTAATSTGAADTSLAATVPSTVAADPSPMAAAIAADRAAALAPASDRPEGDGEEDLASSARSEPATARRTTDARAQDAANRSAEAVPRRQGAGDEGAAQAGGVRYQRLLSQALEDPVVRNLLDRFGGRIVEIKEVP